MSELMYAPLKPFPARGKFITEIDGSTIPHTDFLPSYLQQGWVDLAIGDTDNPTPVRRISYDHGRVHEIERLETNRSYVLDDYGNIFSTRVTQKGAEFSNPHLFESAVSWWDYDVHGTQLLTGLGSVLQVSDRMRREGIDTEMIIGATQLEEFYWEGKIINEKDFQEKLLGKMDSSVTDEKKKTLSQELQARSFFVTYRLMACQERFSDLFLPQTKKEVMQLRTNILEAVNDYEYHRSLVDKTYIPKRFDPNSEEDVKKYISTYLPENLGRNIALMHGIGLYHRYLHMGNITALGGIVDLDSVQGEITGDPEEERIKPEHILTDLERVMFDLQRLSFDEDDKPKKVRVKYIDKETVETYQSTLMYSYFSTLLEKGKFNFTFIDAFHHARKHIAQADERNGTNLIAQIEAEIERMYGEYIPKFHDLVPGVTGEEDVEYKKNMEENPEENKKLRGIVEVDLCSQIDDARYNKPDIVPHESLIESFVDVFTAESLRRYWRSGMIKAHKERYIYSVYRRAINHSYLAHMIVPYMPYFQKYFAQFDSIYGTNTRKDLYRKYGGIIPTSENLQILEDTLYEYERQYHEERLKGSEDTQPEIELGQPESLKEIQDRMNQAIAEWALQNYKSQVKISSDEEDPYEPIYITFVKRYVMEVFGEDKVKELLDYSLRYAQDIRHRLN